jgi:hypothetical protein
MMAHKWGYNCLTYAFRAITAGPISAHLIEIDTSPSEILSLGLQIHQIPVPKITIL